MSPFLCFEGDCVRGVFSGVIVMGMFWKWGSVCVTFLVFLSSVWKRSLPVFESNLGNSEEVSVRADELFFNKRSFL